MLSYTMKYEAYLVDLTYLRRCNTSLCVDWMWPVPEDIIQPVGMGEMITRWSVSGIGLGRWGEGQCFLSTCFVECCSWSNDGCNIIMEDLCLLYKLIVCVQLGYFINLWASIDQMSAHHSLNLELITNFSYKDMVKYCFVLYIHYNVVLSKFSCIILVVPKFFFKCQCHSNVT